MIDPGSARRVDPDGYRRNLLAAALPTLLVPVAIGGALLAGGTRLDALAIGLGAVGRLLALATMLPDRRERCCRSPSPSSRARPGGASSSGSQRARCTSPSR